MRTKSMIACWVFVASLMISVTAIAEDECTTNDDCVQGMVCEEIHTGCPDIPNAPPCDDRENRCVSPGCEDDEDCSEDLRCLVVAQSSGGQITKRCGPRYLAPCEQASDCGDHFECVEKEGLCATSVSSNGDVDERCAPNYFRCEPEIIECASENDCPDGWVCEASSYESCRIDADMGLHCEGPEDVRCFPPELVPEPNLDMFDEESPTTNDALMNSPEASGDTSNSDEQASGGSNVGVSDDTSGRADSASGTGNANGDNSASGALSPVTGQENDDDSLFGCQFVPGGGSGGALALMWFLSVLFFRRRLR